MGTSVFAGTGSFQEQAGASLGSGHPNGINGNVTSSGANGGGNIFSSAASYSFNGTAAQVTGTFLPSTVKNLTINNPAGVTLPKSDTINGHIDAHKRHLENRHKKYHCKFHRRRIADQLCRDGQWRTLKVNGVGSTQTIFPVGIAGGYAPLWITNTGTVDTITAGVVLDTLGGTKNSGGRVKAKWNIAENTPGGSNAALQFGWVSSLEDPIFSTNRAGNAKIFRLSDTTQVGTGSYTSQLDHGAVHRCARRRDGIRCFCRR